MRNIQELLLKHENVWFYISEAYHERFYNELVANNARFMNGAEITPESIGHIVGVHADWTVGCVSNLVWYNTFFSPTAPLKVDYEKYAKGNEDYVIIKPNIIPLGFEKL